MAEVDWQLAALEYAIRVISPGWEPVQLSRRPPGPGVLPKGSLAKTCLQVLREKRELSTPELVALVAERWRVTFSTKELELRFAARVVTALRRFERSGLLQEVGKDRSTQAIRWRLRIDAEGRLSFVKKAA